MKPKTTFEWAELFLQEFLKDIKARGHGPETVESLESFLRLHASCLQDSAKNRLQTLENRVRALESDAGLAKIRGAG
jgi:hypothetical protein